MILSGSVTIYTSEKGIKRTERYWLASALSEGVTVETEGWTTEVQTATAEKPYLWTYEKVVYTDDSYEVFGPVVNSVRGAQGWKGALPRIGKWEAGGTYYQGGEGEEFYDIKLYNGKYYLCRGTHAGHTTTPDLDTEWWIEATDEWKFISTGLILSDNGVIRNFNADYITMTDENDNIVFEAKDGEVTCNTGTFQNIKVSGDSELTDVSILGNIRHSTSLSSTYGKADIYTLPAITTSPVNITIINTKEDDTGKRCFLVNNSTYADGGCYRVKAPTFGWTSAGTRYTDTTYEASDSPFLLAPQEVIELTCFPLPANTVVSGVTYAKGGRWRITNRFSGYSLQPIVAMGIVTNSATSTTATISAQSIFGTDGFSVTRSSTGKDDGLYTIQFPSLFSHLYTPIVQLTGVGLSQGYNKPAKATFISWDKTTRKMVVEVSDNEQPTGGSFSFVVYSFNGWDKFNS